MNERQRWQQNNAEYLSGAVDWIRRRLTELASAGGSENPSSNNSVHDPREAMERAASFEPAPAALVLKRRFDLSNFELEILLLCCSMELDTRVPALCAHVHGDGTKAYPTYALSMALFDDPVWEALAPDRPLRYWKLLEINHAGALPVTASPIRADERIVNYVKGLNHIDERLAAFVHLVETEEGSTPNLAPSHSQITDSIAERLKATGSSRIVHLLGPDSASKQAIVLSLSSELGLELYQIEAETLPAGISDCESLARLWRRETLLLPLSLYIDAHDADRDLPAVNRFLARSGGLLFLDTREAWKSTKKQALTVEVDRPSPSEQRDAWISHIGDSGMANVLASQFHMSLTDIGRIAGSSQQTANRGETLWSACRAASRPRLDLLAQRLEPKATWDDLVLPEQETAALREIAAQARARSMVYDDWGFRQRMNRGLGISSLFAGESGTGKTMAAEVIANELGLNLYRIDLSAVVSKYIGETEKNLRQVFDAAEDGGTILFFDEADALFGKRSEVKDSHDRYANIEVNYLLQRTEAYSGLAILATNLKSALDPAFLRRLRFIVHFPFPGAAERERIWRRAFPASMPVDQLDFTFLSRLNVAGGTVHNIALRAAFLAAQQRSRVSMPVLLEAARSEFRKLERPINENDFRWPKAGAAA